MKRICVFCGSSPGSRPEYLDAARTLGRLLAQQEIGLVYGGGALGLMGELARSCLDAGGDVIGVVPTGLFSEEAVYMQLKDLRAVATMHERKALMADLSDAFITLPGGLGTLEEMFEILTHGQIGVHEKACGILNVCGYYDGLIKFLDQATDELFIAAAHRNALLIDDNPRRLLTMLREFKAPKLDKVAWLRQAAGREK